MAAGSRWHITKPEVTAEQGMVVGKHPLAVEAGLGVLRRGGNAVDAAVTTAFAATVTLPFSNGIGGGGYAVIHLAREGRTEVVDYAFKAPLRARPDMYELTDGPPTGIFNWPATRNNEHQEGYRSMAVPGTVAGLSLALERYGTISLAEALAPAIRLASEGFPVDWHTFLLLSQQSHLIARYPSSAAIFFRGGAPLRAAEVAPGSRLVNPRLADTLRKVAAGGPEVFYRGEIARAIAADIRTGGGLLDEADLAAYQAQVVAPVAGRYRGYDLYGPPNSCGAPTVVETLHILEGFNLSQYAPNDPRRLHLLIEAARRAFADRYAYMADPKQVPVPWDGLLSADYAAARRAEIDPARHTPAQPGDPWRYQPGGRPEMALAGSPAAPDNGTTHLSVVDRDRNMVALTQTLLGWSGIALPATGIVMNNGMGWFDPVPGRANSVAAGKTGLSNMAPFLVLREGRPFLVVGAPGGRRIMNTNMQVMLGVIDHGLGMQEAVELPRMDASGPTTLLDNRHDESTFAALQALGHQLTPTQESQLYRHFASPSCIMVDPVTGRLHGGEDAYSGGVAAGT